MLDFDKRNMEKYAEEAYRKRKSLAWTVNYLMLNYNCSRAEAEIVVKKTYKKCLKARRRAKERDNDFEFEDY